MKTQRCYKDAFSHEQSVGIIVSSSETHFDPEIVKVFVDLKEDFKAVRVEMNG